MRSGGRHPGRAARSLDVRMLLWGARPTLTGESRSARAQADHSRDGHLSSGVAQWPAPHALVLDLRRAVVPDGSHALSQGGRAHRGELATGSPEGKPYSIA